MVLGLEGGGLQSSNLGREVVFFILNTCISRSMKDLFLDIYFSVLRVASCQISRQISQQSTVTVHRFQSVAQDSARSLLKSLGTQGPKKALGHMAALCRSLSDWRKNICLSTSELLNIL